MEHSDHPSPQNQWWENGAFWPSRTSSLIWGRGGISVPFYSVQDCNLGQIKWNIQTTPPPKISDGKMARFGLHALHPWFGGEGAFLFHFILSKIAILDKLNGTFRPPLPPKSVMGKWRVLAFTHFILDLGERGHFCSILFCPRLQSWTN